MKMFTKFLTFAIIAILVSGGAAFGQITQRGTGTTGTTTSATLSIPKPSGLAVGDVMIANIVQGDNDANATLSNATGAGWTLVRGAEFGVNGNNDWWATVLYKVAVAADVAATNFSFTLDPDANNDGSVGGIVAFYNVSTTGGVGPDGSGTGPFDVAAGTYQFATSATVTAPGISTVTANAVVIMLGMAADNNTFGSWTTTSPGALTEVFDDNLNGSTDETAAAAWALKTGTGPTGDGTATMNNSDPNAGILIALKPIPPSVTLTPANTQYILTGGSVNLTAAALHYTGSGNYTYTWTATGATISGGNTANVASASNLKTLTYAAAGNYKVSVQIARSGSATLVTDSVTVIVSNVPAVANLWATSSNGTQISSFTVVNGIFINGPSNLFVPTFPGTTTSGTSTAALARNAQGGVTNGFYYWLPNTSGNSGVVEIFAGNASGSSQARVGSIDVNGASGNSLGFVRLGVGPDGNGWLLAGDGSTLYLAKFMTNGLNPVTITTVPISLGTGSAGVFQNGDICISGNNKLFALANDGNGVTQIFVGNLNSPSVVINPRLNLVDQNNAPFTGSVNGVAFDELGSAYISTASGLYFIDAATVDGPAATVLCTLVSSVTGLQDLASNVFPVGSPLPVTLIDFKGNYRNQNTTLSWETENMYNFSHFEVERSATGSNYATIGSLNQKGDGISRSQYQYIDNLAGVSGKVFYYRLKMIDMDGQFKYSNIIVVRKEQGSNDKISIYPNPLTTGVKATVSFTASASKTVNFSVVDMTGKIVATQQSNVAAGNNSVTIKSLDNLQPGMYIIRANDGESIMSVKFYIVR